MSYHKDNATVCIDDDYLRNIEVDLIYPRLLDDSKIFYVRTDAQGNRVRLPLKFGTTQQGRQWQRPEIIRYAIAWRIQQVIGHRYMSPINQEKIIEVFNDFG